MSNSKASDTEETTSEECLCEESENGICNDCGAEVDWVRRTFAALD